MDGKVEGIDTAVVGLQRHGGNDVSPLAETLGLDAGPRSERCHVLRTVQQSQSFLGSQTYRLPAHALVQFGTRHQFALILHLAQSDQRQTEMRQGYEVATGTYRTLHIDHGIDVVVEEVDESFDGVELTTRIAVAERLNLQQNHNLHNVVGNAFATAAGMRHHQVYLQLCQLVGSDANLAERTKTGSHTIDGLFALGNLPVEVFATADDALTGVGTEFQLVVVCYNLFDLVKGQMTRRDLMDIHKGMKDINGNTVCR